MPGLAPPTANPYPTVEQVMNIARARVNDMTNDSAGDLLADNVPSSQQYLNAAWSWLQKRCATAGVETFKKEITLFQLPAQASQDPANQAWVTWLGCSDGVNQYPMPTLPQDLIQPLSVWQRQSGSQGEFFLMYQAQDGLPRWFDYQVYDWRADGLYFYAPTYQRDLQIRYSAYRQSLDLTRPGDAVPIMMCEDALGARIAFEFASARGAMQAGQMKQWADEAFEQIALGSSQRRQRQSTRRQPYNRRRTCAPFPYIQNS